MSETERLIIIGSGPAALTAAIYAARADLKPFVIEGFLTGGVPGGQLMTTTEVENYPGFPQGITGPDLVDQMRKQAERFGTRFLGEDVVKVGLQQRPFTVQTAKQTFSTHSLIVATGATAKRLDIPGTRDGEFWQKGVSACAVCDGAMPIFRNKDLYVIGGGDTAAEEALFLTKFASHVYVVHRRDQLRASKIMADRVLQHPKITVLWNSGVTSVTGDTLVRHLVVKDLVSGAESEREAAGLFFAIGHQPNTGFLEGQLPLDPSGYLLVQPGSSKTTTPGVFAAGDVQDHVYRQAVTAAGSGCMAALDAERWLAAEGIE